MTNPKPDDSMHPAAPDAGSQSPKTHSPSHSSSRRFIVGIDLGTTNSAVSFIDLESPPVRIESFPLFQKTAPGESENRPTLPSFLFLDPSGEVEVGTYARDFGANQPGRLIWSAKSWLCHSQVDRTAAFLPWKSSQDIKKMSPVDAQARYLKFIAQRWNDAHPSAPLDKQDVVITLPASFDETARQLTVRAAAKAGLQKIVLIEEPQAAFYAWIYKSIIAADKKNAEKQKNIADNNNFADKSADASPLATFSATQIKRQNVLVIDVGGGTSDFSLIRIVPQSENADAPGAYPHRGVEEVMSPNKPDSKIPASNQEPTSSGRFSSVSFHRVAVGEHLLLGGDNLDLALAKYLESKFAADGVTLTDRQWQALVRQARIVKEALLGENPPQTYTASIPASGSKLIAKSLHQTVTKEEVQQLLLDGFFPLVDLSAKPSNRRSGFQEFGLPFAQDPAITRYLAAFLTAHNEKCDAVLFNGGMFESPLTRERILTQLSQWFPSKDGTVVLDNDALDLAVSRGAAYFGLVRRLEQIKSNPENDAVSQETLQAQASKLAIRIHATLARSYYIGLENNGQLRAMCIAPADIQEGQTLEINIDNLRLQTGVPVTFPLFVSSYRTTDRPGEIIDLDENQTRALAPLRTVIKESPRGGADATVQTAANSPQNPLTEVSIETHLTEIGALELTLVEKIGAPADASAAPQPKRGRWKLNFDIRSAVETDVKPIDASDQRDGVIDENIVSQAKEALRSCFESFEFKPSEIVKRLTGIIGQSRENWPASLLRSLFDALLDFEPSRKKSAAFEARWLNLAGFCLRPGFGAAMDDWRVEQLWKCVFGKMSFPQPDNRLQLWILWRRVATGLSSGRQSQLTEMQLRQLRSLTNRLKTGRGRNEWTYNLNESTELFRLFGAMEKLSIDRKVELGFHLLTLLEHKEYASCDPAIIWSLGRLGARDGLDASLETILSPTDVEPWIKSLLRRAKSASTSETAFALALMSRKTEDRYRDIPDSLRKDVLRCLESFPNVNPHWITLVRDGGKLEDEQREETFGESLPFGLKIE